MSASLPSTALAGMSAGQGCLASPGSPGSSAPPIRRVEPSGEARYGRNDELVRQLRERHRTLEAANKELAAFAYTVAHDLRQGSRRR